MTKRVMIQCLDEKSHVQVNVLRKKEGTDTLVSQDVRTVGAEGATFTVFEGQELRIFELPSGKEQEELPLVAQPKRSDVVRPSSSGGAVGATTLPPSIGGGKSK